MCKNNRTNDATQAAQGIVMAREVLGMLDLDSLADGTASWTILEDLAESVGDAVTQCQHKRRDRRRRARQPSKIGNPPNRANNEQDNSVQMMPYRLPLRKTATSAAHNIWVGVSKS